MQIAVLGAGSWGTALAILLARNGHAVRLWAHRAEHVAAMTASGENGRFLPGIAFPHGLTPVAELAAAVEGCRELLVAVPSHAFPALMQQLSALIPADTRIAWASKGLEPGSSRLLHEVALEKLGQRPLAVISGPTFAREVAEGLPTAVTVAANDSEFAACMANYLRGSTFRSYTCDDMVSVEVGGAFKNILAIAAGIADGIGYGANTRAALITRGLAEMQRMATALGGHSETLMGLAGLGDLVLTCTDDQSRNRRCGLLLGQGKTLEQAQQAIGQVVEGVGTVREARTLAARVGVEMPITEQVFQVVYGGLKPRMAVQSLLHRQPKAEGL
jgi:glycerol-3-phosphate dehydrogenase (NAD(P)+)